jgi:chemotaxis protein histidine kinase CheA
MLNGFQWQDRYPEFLSDSQALLSRSQECLLHLELISNDQDAIECLLSTLETLTRSAENAAVTCVAEFSRQLFSVLQAIQPLASMQSDVLQTLKDCFTLLAWQLELIDPRDGGLALDDSEQCQLLERLATLSGLDEPANSLSLHC